MHRELLLNLARHQAWADAAHWKALRENPTLGQDAEIRKRLNHILQAMKMLTTLARGGAPDFARPQEIETIEELETAMGTAQADLIAAVESVDPDRVISLPRGPKGPFEAPAGVVLLQAITHGQHHRGQNSARMRQLGATPPMTDFIMWYAMGQP